MNDRSALTDELKLEEDNSDSIKVHLQLTAFPHRDRKFSKNSGREHANPPNVSIPTHVSK